MATNWPYYVISVPIETRVRLNRHIDGHEMHWQSRSQCYRLFHQFWPMKSLRNVSEQINLTTNGVATNLVQKKLRQEVGKRRTPERFYMSSPLELNQTKWIESMNQFQLKFKISSITMCCQQQQLDTNNVRRVCGLLFKPMMHVNRI